MQLYCPHCTASADVRNVVRVSVEISYLGLPVVFAPLAFTTFDPNLKFVSGTSGILLIFGVVGGSRLPY